MLSAASNAQVHLEVIWILTNVYRLWWFLKDAVFSVTVLSRRLLHPEDLCFIQTTAVNVLARLQAVNDAGPRAGGVLRQDHSCRLNSCLKYRSIRVHDLECNGQRFHPSPMYVGLNLISGWGN